MSKTSRIAFVWDNFGPLHVDRCNAVARSSKNDCEVFGIELFGSSDLYDWANPEPDEFRKITLFETGGWATTGPIRMAMRIAATMRSTGCSDVFLSHYERPAIILASILLRLRGVRVFTMGCSKLDDAARHRWREAAKRLLMRPYRGALGSEYRSLDYFRHLGFDDDHVAGGYNTVDHRRLLRLAQTSETTVEFEDRPFLVVARLIPEKNFPRLLQAYADYSTASGKPRKLQIAGSGPLENELRAHAASLGIADQIEWLGFAQSAQVAQLMRDGLCLLLPSRSETFGNVVAEALAFGLPVIASAQCGAAGFLVRDGVNGRVIDHRDVGALSQAMADVAEDPNLWERWRVGSARLSRLGDAARFSEGVAKLLRSA